MGGGAETELGGEILFWNWNACVCRVKRWTGCRGTYRIILATILIFSTLISRSLTLSLDPPFPANDAHCCFFTLSPDTTSSERLTGMLHDDQGHMHSKYPPPNTSRHK